MLTDERIDAAIEAADPFDDLAEAGPEAATESFSGSAPTPQQIDAYRKLVFAVGRGDPEHGAAVDEVIMAAWRLRREFDRDLATFKERLTARRHLDKMVPRLRNRVVEAQAAAEAFKGDTLANRSPSSFDTLAELHVALTIVGNRNTPGVVTHQARELHEVQRELRSTEMSARQTLCNSAAPTIQNEIVALHKRREGVKHRIGERAETLRLPERITALRRRLTELGSDKASDEGEQSFCAAEYRRLRSKFSKLLQLQPQRAAALAADESDRRELAKLAAEIERLESTKLDPENMRWEGGPENLWTRA